MPDVRVTKNSYTIDSLYQWDLNQELTVYGLSLPVTPEVHFAHDGQELAIVRQASMDAAGVVRVQVPNSLLEKAARINAYVCTTEGTSFQSLYKIVIPVIGRAKPSDWEGTDEVEVYSLDALGVEVYTLEPGADATVEKVLDRAGGWTLRFSIPKGRDGNSIKTITRTSGDGSAGTTDTYTVTLTDGSTSTFQVYNGKDGGGMFVVTLSVSGRPPKYKSDKTLAEILAAIESGAVCVAEFQGVVSPLVYHDDTMVSFSLSGLTDDGNGGYYLDTTMVEVTADEVNVIAEYIQPAITGTAGDFVVIGDDGKPTTKTIGVAEEASV